MSTVTVSPGLECFPPQDAIFEFGTLMNDVASNSSETEIVPANKRYPATANRRVSSCEGVAKGQRVKRILPGYLSVIKGGPLDNLTATTTKQKKENLNCCLDVFWSFVNPICVL